MSFNAPNPSKPPYTIAHATVVVIDAATGLPAAIGGSASLTDTQLRAAPIVIDAGTKAHAVPALGDGGQGLVGWLSQIWSALTGTLKVSGPLTFEQLRMFPVNVILPLPTAVDLTIAAGESLSNFGAMDIFGGIGGIGIPADWTAAPLTLQACFDGDGLEWFDVLANDGTEYVVNAVPLKLNTISVSLRGFMIRLRSGTANAPVPQDVTCTIKLMILR